MHTVQSYSNNMSLFSFHFFNVIHGAVRLLNRRTINNRYTSLQLHGSEKNFKLNHFKRLVTV